MRISRTYVIAAVSLALLPLMSCGDASPHDPLEKYYLVATNIKLPYWQQAFAGLNRAAFQLGVKVEMVGPEVYDARAEHEEFQRVIGQKPAGILVSVSEASVIAPDIDAAIAQGIPVITVDSDAPHGKRLMFVGTDNYKAGMMGAKVVVDKLQGKGNVLVYSMPEQENLQERLHGYKDIFADHPQIKITDIIDIKGDPRIAFDKTMALLDKGPGPDAFICLEAIACPEVAEVLDRKRVSGKVVVAMDTVDRTLDGIKKGLISATIGQKPFTMAFQGLKIVDDLHHHPLPNLTTNWSLDPFSPIAAFVDTGATLVDQSNVNEFITASKSATNNKK